MFLSFPLTLFIFYFLLQECGNRKDDKDFNFTREVCLGPSEVSNSPNCVQVSVRFENRHIKLEQNQTETVCQLRKSISEKEKLDPSSVRLLLHGQRLDDKETIETLALSDSDVIEAFLEMSGGGKPEKPKTLVDEKEMHLKRVLKTLSILTLNQTLMNQ